jgi:hypothetical protein
MVDDRLLHDATLMRVNVFDALQFIKESWHCVTHVTIVNSFQKCGFDLNLTSDGEDATEFVIAKAEGSCISSKICIL